MMIERSTVTRPHGHAFTGFLSAHLGSMIELANQFNHGSNMLQLLGSPLAPDKPSIVSANGS